jgi:hypothetical protein
LAYDGERADAVALDQLEAVLRHVVDELTAWHTRALDAEAALKDSATAPRGPAAGAGSGARHEPELRVRAPELEQENKQLRLRVEAARSRVSELLSRLTFLEDQARDQAGGAR